MMVENVWMVGPGETQPGGMSAVIASYRRGGLFETGGVRYRSSYEGKSPITQLRVFGGLAIALVVALARRKVALLHVHSAARGSFWRKSLLCAAMRLAGRPYVFHVHSGEFVHLLGEQASAPVRAWARHTLQHAERVLALTPAWVAPLQQLCPNARVVLLPNPVAVPVAPQTLRDPAARVLFLGRLREAKGATDLLRAWPGVIRSCPQARLVMAGDGDLVRLEQLASTLGVRDSVEFPGWIQGAAKAAAWAAADVYVLPSYYEGLPIGVLEALAQGVPVVASRVGGIPDLIKHRVSGWLHEPGDVTALQEGLVALLSDATLRKTVATSGREVASSHAEPLVVQELLRLYDDIATGRAKRSR